MNGFRIAFYISGIVLNIIAITSLAKEWRDNA
jgi:hypothetical protein